MFHQHDHGVHFTMRRPDEKIPPVNARYQVNGWGKV
jgi:hypothetical protein